MVAARQAFHKLTRRCLRMQVSLRPFVSGLRTTLPVLKKLVTMFNGFNTFNIQFDTKVYGATQKLAAVLCCKGMAPRWVHNGKESQKGFDDRRLVPCDWSDWQDSFDIVKLEDYVAQAVCDKDPFLLPSPGAAAEENDSEQFDIPQQNKRPRFGYSICNAFNVLQPILHSHGFLNAYVLPGSEEFDGHRLKCFFNCDNHLDCKICGYDHERHNYYFNANRGGANVGNFSERCRCVNLFDCQFLHKFANTIIDARCFCHAEYSDMYADYKNGMLKYDIQNKKFWAFAGTKWVEVPKEAVRGDIEMYFRKQLCEGMLSKLSLWLEKCRVLEMTDCVTYLEGVFDEVKKRTKDIGHANFLSGVLSCLESKILVEHNIFNRHDDLLHFDDCVMDLSTFTTRETRPEDFNTFTVGFDYYKDDADESAAAMHARVINTIFPDDRVRHTAQKVFGTSLSAKPVKHFFVHTDGGGEKAGNNGKTLLLDLHVESLGDYACRPRRELFYKQNASDSNSATPALTALIGKRIGVAEELESSKQLNESEIKHWTNGTNVTVATRQLYQQQFFARLTCKYHVGANNNKFPKCDAVGDQALKDRLFILPYMSKFVNTACDRPLQCIFVRDSELSSKLPVLKWYHMMWCIDGLDLFRKEGLDQDTLPPFMQQFKESVLVQQSPVYEIICDIVVRADADEVEHNIKKKRGLDLRSVWMSVMGDKRFRGFMNQSMVEQAFKSVCKGMQGCERCIKYDSAGQPYSTHHKLMDKQTHRSADVQEHDSMTNVGHAFM